MGEPFQVEAACPLSQGCLFSPREVVKTITACAFATRMPKPETKLKVKGFSSGGLALSQGDIAASPVLNTLP